MPPLTELELKEVEYWIKLLDFVVGNIEKHKLIYRWTAGHLITCRQYLKLVKYIEHT